MSKRIYTDERGVRYVTRNTEIPVSFKGAVTCGICGSPPHVHRWQLHEL
jgi:hypothetical protein